MGRLRVVLAIAVVLALGAEGVQAESVAPHPLGMDQVKAEIRRHESGPVTFLKCVRLGAFHVHCRVYVYIEVLGEGNEVVGLIPFPMDVDVGLRGVKWAFPPSVLEPTRRI